VLVSDPRLSPPEIERIRSLAAEGASVIAWQHRAIVQDRFPSPDVEAALAAASIPAITLSDTLEADFEIDEAVISWMKDLGRRAFRGRFRLEGLDLWWWAEI
jgi:hypothetical protein